MIEPSSVKICILFNIQILSLSFQLGPGEILFKRLKTFCIAMVSSLRCVQLQRQMKQDRHVRIKEVTIPV